MSTLYIDDVRIENYVAQFDGLTPDEQRVVYLRLSKKRNAGGAADEEVERKAQLLADHAEQTLEERKAAGRRFIESWRGALKGAPDMTAKEIRAERLERKYGQ